MPAFRTMIGDELRAPRPTRSTPALLIGAVVILLGSAPGLRAQSAAPSEKAASKPAVVEKTKAVAELEPFDLSYIPAKAKSLMIDRPAAISRRKGMEAYRDGFALSLSPELNIVVRVEGGLIEQRATGFLREGVAGVNVGAGRPDPGFWVVRAVRDLDWKKLIVDSSKGQTGKVSDWMNVAFEGRTYCKLVVRNVPPEKEPEGPRFFGVNPDLAARSLQVPPSKQPEGPCFYFPDARTVVVADEECIRGLIRQPADSRPGLARGDGWQAVSRSLIAAAWEQDGPEYLYDAVSGMMMEVVGVILPFRTRESSRCYCGLDDREKFRVTATYEFPSNKEAARAALEAMGSFVAGKIGLAVQLWTGAGKELDMKRGMIRSMLDLAWNGWVRYDGRTLAVVSRCKMGLAEFDRYFGGLATPAEDRKQARR